MGIFTPIVNLFLREERASVEDPRTSLSNPSAWLSDFFGRKANNGKTVSYETAQTVSAVWASWRILSETISSLGLEVLENVPNGVQPAYNHPLYPILNACPSPLYTSFNWREAMMLNALAFGTAYSFIIRNANGKVIELRVIPSQEVEIVVMKGEPYYKVRGVNKTFTMDEILAIPVMAFNGIAGADMIGVAKDILGEALAAGEFGSNYLGNGAMLSGVIEYDGELSSERAEKLKSSWSKNYQGAANSGKTALLEYGMKYRPISGSASEANLLELRQFYIQEVARYYNIPPHMIGELSRSTNNNIEQQSIDFVRYTIRPYIKRWEQELNRKLFTTSEQKKYFVRFNLDSLLRGDTEARAEYYSKLFSVGVLSPNDIRKLENMNPIEDGDYHYKPMNFNELGNEPNEAPHNNNE